MTDLKKPISRVSAGKVREVGKAREIVITLEPPNLLYFRAKGCRKRYALTAEHCYILAVRADVAAKMKEKARNKRNKKGRKIRFKAPSKPLGGRTQKKRTTGRGKGKK